MMVNMHDIGVVVIGRNEGDRLKRCLCSTLKQVNIIVYVDSGSSDGSVAYAKSIGAEVVKLDMSTPFSAGRARNKGFQYLVNNHQDLNYIQFIDGDCELCEEWLAFACEYLASNTPCAIVAGRRKEQFPEKSIYNQLCDIEWDSPTGAVKSCGGDFLVRKSAFLEVEGFNPTVVAGEEPELCYRLRQREWKIYRLDHLMTLHDAAMTRFSQWWKRAVRSGHAYAQGYSLHGSGSEKYYLRESLRIWFWALLFPVFILLMLFFVDLKYLLIFTVYPVQLLRIAHGLNKRIENWKHSLAYATFVFLGKLPQLMGYLFFMKKKFTGGRFSIIEYN